MFVHRTQNKTQSTPPIDRFALAAFNRVWVSGKLQLLVAEQNNYRLAAGFNVAHQPKDSGEAAYLKSNLIDKRKILMQDWAEYCYRACS